MSHPFIKTVQLASVHVHSNVHTADSETETDK